MSYIKHNITSDYWYSLKIGKDAVLDSWPFMSDPSLVTAITSFYLLFVLWLGPTIMRKRSPMKLTNIMILYNASEVLLSCIVIYKASRANLLSDGLLLAGCRYSGNKVDYQIADYSWWLCFAKITELMDTVFFILRKKDRQVTFLHVYHHAFMVAYVWATCKFTYSGQGAIIGSINSIIHVVMYSYYLLSAMGPAVQKYLWWKKYLTLMQMIQFVIIGVYLSITHFNPACSFSKMGTYIIFVNTEIFLGLFLKFYFNTYSKETISQVQKQNKHKKIDHDQGNRRKAAEEKKNI